MGGDSHSARSAMWVANPPPERQPESEPHIPHPPTQFSRMDVSMMKACGTQQWHCWGNFQGHQKTPLQREVSHLSPCGWEGWGCVRRHGEAILPIGIHGPTLWR